MPRFPALGEKRCVALLAVRYLDTGLGGVDGIRRHHLRRTEAYKEEVCKSARFKEGTQRIPWLFYVGRALALATHNQPFTTQRGGCGEVGES